MDQLRKKLGEVADMHSAIALLQWDQEVNMPPKAAPGRGQQIATLSALAHGLVTAPEMGDLLRTLNDQADSSSPDEAMLVSEALYDYERATKLPEDYVHRFALEQCRAYDVWLKAREASNFSLFKPHLEIMVDLLRQRAEYFGYEDSPYDALLEDYERGMSTAAVRSVFAELAVDQSALVAQIMDSPHQPNVEWTKQEWDEDRQWAFTLEVIEALGYDFEAGRQDRSVHPFSTNFDIYDVRVTTRVSKDDLFSALTGSIHECGHALYEQGFQEADRRTPLAEGISLGIHESQSRLWENMIGRSLPFWKHFAPKFQSTFPSQLDGVGADQMYAAVNEVNPSFIRVEADECTYNLHVILRFEIEVDLIEGRLAVADVPEAWNTKMKAYLGLEVPNDTVGCLQDIHWSHGSMGYFPTYALGNLYGAQMFDQVEADAPALWDEVAQGDFSTLLGWLRQNVHRCGRRKLAADLIRDISGRDLESGPYLRYLRGKYGALYQL
jgi:carboxypeptidase Taq